MRDSTKAKKRKGILRNIAESVLFGREVQQLVEVINTDLKATQVNAAMRPISHPAGFVSLITGRWLSIAEAYVRLLACSHMSGYDERIEALQSLLHHMRFSEKKSMSVDTGRVQIALMEKAVAMRHDRQAQLELMSDFSQASSEKGMITRQLLKELNLIEISGCPGKLYEQVLTWDDHVHESLANDYHSRTQLVLNAFVQGVSKITVSHYDLTERQQIEETLLASKMLGIHSQIAIRFSVGRAGQRRNYMFIPVVGWKIDAFWEFWEIHREKLKPFWDGVEENSRRRADMIRRLVQRFNDEVVPAFNEPYVGQEALLLPPLSWMDVEDVTRHGQVNRKHLGLVIFKAMRPVALKRALFHQNEYRMMEPGSPEALACLQKYEEAQRIYDELSPSLCIDKYISHESEIDYDSVFEQESDIFPMLSECNAYLAYIRELRRGIPNAVDNILNNYKYLTDIEVYNLVDAERLGESIYTQFAAFVHALMEGDVSQVESLMKAHGMAARPHEEIEAACAYIKAHPFYTRCASDSIGWSSQITGMGFFHEFQLDTAAFNLIRQNGHKALGESIGELLSAHRPKDSDKKGIYILSSHKDRDSLEAVNGESENDGMLLRLWRYLNARARCYLKVIAGLIPLCITIYLVQDYQALGLWIAVIWFGVTACRNCVVDMISSSGIGPKNWKLQSVDWENLCTSLFFTGFSVPILSLAKYGFDRLWMDSLGWETGFVFTFVKFWVIALANGLYLAAHNTLRGFAKPAIRGNFFRSVLSWPLATAMSYGLTPLGVPDVVQAKLASEVVAGLIEGVVKYRRRKSNARRALYEVYQQLKASDSVQALLAKLDILYFWTFSLSRKELEGFIRAPEKVRGLDESQIAEVAAGNHILQEFFEQKDSLREMTCAVLKYYPEEKLVALNDLAGENYRPFVQWLRKINNHK